MRLGLLSTSEVLLVAVEVQRCIATIASEHGRGKTGGYLYLRDPREDIGICMPAGVIEELKLG